MRPFIFFHGLLAMFSLAINALHCTTPSDTIMAHNISSAEHLQARSASAIKAKLAIPWPLVTRNGRRLRVVRYCYGDKYTRDLFNCRVQDALTLWAERIGYPAGPATGHSLSWDEADDRNRNPIQRQIEYCFLPGLVDGQVVWNPKVDKDTLRISENLGQGSLATTGYRLGARYAVGFHWMQLQKNAVVEEVAHEGSRTRENQSTRLTRKQLGHVLGMSHEFIRSDRDASLLYTCTNVAGYTTALALALSTDPSLTPAEAHTNLCTSTLFADAHSFLGANFVKNDLGRVHDDSPALDVASIMMYPSDTFARDGCPEDRMKCPLLRYPPEEYWFGGVRVPELVRHADVAVPSAGDGEWVRWYYPAEE